MKRKEQKQKELKKYIYIHIPFYCINLYIYIYAYIYKKNTYTWYYKVFAFFGAIFFLLSRMVLSSLLTFSSTPYYWAIYVPRGTIRGDADADGVRGRGGRSTPNHILVERRPKSFSLTAKSGIRRKRLPTGSLLEPPEYNESRGRALRRLYLRRREPRRRGQVHGQATGKR